MKINSQIKNDVENNKDVNGIVCPEEDEAVLSNNMNMPFFGVLQNQINSSDELSDLNMNQNSADYNFDCLNMNIEDAKFFINLAEEGEFSVNINNNGEFSQIIQTKISPLEISKKSIEVTNKLAELIEKANTTQKPVRITFDNDVSVILKIDKHGKLTAEFIPGSIEVENYLRNNISALRQKFDEQNLPYNDLLYRQNSKQNKRKNKGEG